MTREEKILALYTFIHPKQRLEYPDIGEIKRKMRMILSKAEIDFFISPRGWKWLKESPELRDRIWSKLKEVV